MNVQLQFSESGVSKTFTVSGSYGEERLLHRAVKFLYDCRSEGDILMDAPRTDSWCELKMWAADRQKWRMRVQSVRSDAKVSITSSVFVPESVLSFTIS